MTHFPFANELQVALAAVRQAAIACRSVQDGITTAALDKKDKSPVTVADFASQAVICKALMDAFPEDPVIGEEGAADLRSEKGASFLDQVVAECANAGCVGSGEEVCDWIDRGGLQEYRNRFWTLDPIDGTKGFLRKEQYAISLALVVDGEIEIGILGCPNMPTVANDPNAPKGILAWAVKGRGSFYLPLDQQDVTATVLRVAGTREPSNAKFCESVESGHSSHSWSGQIAESLSITNEPFRIDSQCKYLAVAMGAADIYLRLPTRPGYVEKIWDHAGGILIVEEAGGMVSDIAGRSIDLTHGATLNSNEGMVVTNGKFHDKVVSAVTENRPA
ncbi:MAG: 3'(2'),5'-bisphosphate nucleotidase [Fuerstiella sp.]